MRISTKGRYSVRAMIDVACNCKKRPVRLKELSERTDISRNYLVQLFQQLKRAGLVKSVRGPTGGFVLSKPSHEISVKDILSAVNESFTPVNCLNNNSKQIICSKSKQCVARSLWAQLKGRVEEFLTNTTLESLEVQAIARGPEKISAPKVEFSI